MSPAVRKWIIASVIGVFVLGVLSVVGLASMLWWYSRDVAELDEARLRDYRPSQVTRIYSREGVLVGELFTKRRRMVRYDEIPSHVESAFLAAEDADFYKHEGLDYLGIVRALLVNLRAGEVRQGASTITQQVVKVFLLSPERTFDRKVQELVLARRLEKAFTKQEILELYLNEIYLGHGRYGIEEASWYYFGKSVREINLGQAALLATLPKAPGRDSPIKNRERAKERQVWVLRQMIEHGFATAELAKPFIEADLPLAKDGDRREVVAGAEEFVDEVRTQLEAHYGAETLDTLGADVYTTVSMPLQQAAREAVLGGLRALDERQKYAHALTPAKPKAVAKARTQGQGASVGDSVPALVVAPPSSTRLPEGGFAAEIGDKPAFVRVPAGSRYDDSELDVAAQFPAGAIVRVRVTGRGGGKPAEDLPDGWLDAVVDAGPEGAFVLADVETGEILAMVGGSSYALGQFNRALHAERQPGSAFKPFVYGAALASRAFTPATIVSDSPEIYEKWRPTNFEADVYRGDIRLRAALAGSVNTVAIKLLDRVGIDAVHDFARACGIVSDLPDDLSLALGTGEVTLGELLTGYLTLARAGRRIDPGTILRVEVRGTDDWKPERTGDASLPPEVTYVLTSMMQSVVQEGTATKAKALARPIAGKTGTSADHHDAWFAGFTARHVAVAWVGYDRPQPIGKGETGGRAALPIWIDAVRAAEDGPPRSFGPPPSVVIRRIDAASGLLAPPDADPKTTLEEVFVAGTEPVEEAVPAALPAGDVLLGLYEEDAASATTSDEADAPPPAGSADALPSLDDEPANSP